MNYLVLDVLTDYLMEHKFYDIICCLRLVCPNYKNIIDSNKLFIRKKSAEILIITFNKLGIDFDTCWELIEYKPDYKYLLNLLESKIFYHL